MPTVSPLTHLGDISIDEFFTSYWQKKPLFIPQAFKNLYQIDPNILAGYALEQEIESRLIVESPKENALNSHWQVVHGPLDDETFGSLPESHWTLLIQAVDQLDPKLFELMHLFRFVPNWRLDDIMVSYAVNQGSVGPHFDYYDVFLLQAQGKRRWQIGQTCSHKTALQADCDLKILTEFNSTATYEVEPGDLLYIPPQIAHWGIALEESVTYSIGYRAPSVGDALTDFSEHIASTLSNDDRYSDANIQSRSHSGEIDESDILRIKTLLQHCLNDDKTIADWFGQFMTSQKRSGVAFEQPRQAGKCMLAPTSRAAYQKISEEHAKLFINGETFTVNLHAAQTLCSYGQLHLNKLDKKSENIFKRLVELGYLH